MSDYTLYGRAVIGGRVVYDAAVAVKDGVISECGSRESVAPVGDITDFGDALIAPGFIDIHCHAGGKIWTDEDPGAVADYHLSHGTTSLCCTLYRDLGFDGMLEAEKKIIAAMKTHPSILGIHLEGPYLNPSLGSQSTGGTIEALRQAYLPLLECGEVRHITFAPEVKGTDALMEDLRRLGIVGSIGHSAASPAQVRRAASDGAKIVTHLFDATGASVSPARWGGTLEADFNIAALLCDDFYYEIICDSKSVHVRDEYVLLTKKLAGAGRIIGITDACGGEGDGSDVNFVDGELMGSKLTMDRVARNFSRLGFSEAEVVAVTSTNAAKALGVFGDRGELAPRKKADIVVLDGDWTPIKVYKS